jgi:5-methylcytosine-specific restriction enzyme subunit McrC
MDAEITGSGEVIRIINIYHMLAYAFRSLNASKVSKMGSEEFDNLHELLAEIIIHEMRRQLKRGLPHGYTSQSEELRKLRGKIDFQTSIRKLSQVRHRLVCEFDEFTEDTPGNRLIKCAITHLLKHGEISATRKHYLKFIRSSLSGVADIGYNKISPQCTGGAAYVMLVNVCSFLLDGLLMNKNGVHKMRKWLTDERMSSLYEHFLLEYFRRHHADLNARSSRIDWDMQSVPLNMPEMKSDVYLTYGGRTLIIDAKFYSRTMSEHFGKKTFHSHNLYQIYAYVKNADRAKDGSVSGMLLYAKTDEEITPNCDTVIGGNGISVKTLDLSRDFTGIRDQLENIAVTFKNT